MLKNVLIVLSVSMMTACGYTIESGVDCKIPAMTPCPESLPDLQGKTDKDILENRAETYQQYKDCSDKVDTIIKVKQACDNQK